LQQSAGVSQVKVVTSIDELSQMTLRNYNRNITYLLTYAL